MGGNEQLTAREFYKGLDRFDSRFDRLEDKVDSHSDRITALEVLVKGKSRNETRKTITWSGAAATAIVVILEGVRHYLR